MLFGLAQQGGADTLSLNVCGHRHDFDLGYRLHERVALTRSAGSESVDRCAGVEHPHNLVAALDDGCETHSPRAWQVRDLDPSPNLVQDPTQWTNIRPASGQTH